MFWKLMKRPSAFLPIAMSAIGLTIVIAWLATHGVVHEKDEGAVAHIWQLLMAGQLPIIAYFAIRWTPESPRAAIYVLALQLIAGLAAAAPVFYLEL